MSTQHQIYQHLMACLEVTAETLLYVETYRSIDSSKVAPGLDLGLQPLEDIAKKDINTFNDITRSVGGIPVALSFDGGIDDLAKVTAVEDKLTEGEWTFSVTHNTGNRGELKGTSEMLWYRYQATLTN